VIKRAAWHLRDAPAVAEEALSYQDDEEGGQLLLSWRQISMPAKATMAKQLSCKTMDRQIRMETKSMPRCPGNHAQQLVDWRNSVSVGISLPDMSKEARWPAVTVMSLLPERRL